MRALPQARPGSGGPRRVAGSTMSSDAVGYLAETLGLDRAECEVRCQPLQRARQPLLNASVVSTGDSNG